MKPSHLILASLLVIALLVGGVGAKDIVVSGGVSLSDTKENRTEVLKEVVYDLKLAPVTLTKETYDSKSGVPTKDVDGKTLSLTPVSDVLATKEDPAERAAYKAEYIAKYADLVGTHKVTVDGDVFIIEVRDIAYVDRTSLLQMNITVSKDGKSIKVRNPYKIYNPATDVFVSDNGTAEVPESALLETICNAVGNLEEGEATFSDGDPTLTIYATYTRNNSVYNTNGAMSWASAITGSGGYFYTGDSALVYGYKSSFGASTPYGAFRGLMSFDTSSLGSGASIINVSVSTRGSDKEDGDGYAPNYGLTNFVPGSTFYNISDYQTNTTQKYTDYYIPYSVYSTSAFNTLYFSSTGRSLVKKDGYTHVMDRTDYDIDSRSFAPAGDAGFLFKRYSSSYTGTSRDPVMTIIYAISPISSFTPLGSVEGYSPHSQAFVDTSDGPATSWIWQFNNVTGNNTWVTFSTSQNPTHSFGIGNFSINLTATNDLGSDISDQVTFINVSAAPPIISFTTDDQIVLDGQTITFTPVSNAAVGSEYVWEYGDGDTDTVYTSDPVTHAHTVTNIYSPSLTVTDSGTGASNSTTRSEYIGVNSYKYYPSVDGYVSRTSSAVWATIREGAGQSVDSASTSAYSRLSSSFTSNYFNRIDRLIQIYDTENFPEEFRITNASINVYGNSHSNTFGSAPNLVVTDVTALASTTSITASDYNKFGSTSLSDSNVTYAAYNDAAYNKIWLNAAGIAEIDTTDVSIFMLRTSWDADNAPPTWSGSKTGYFRPSTMESATDPYMIVNFSAVPVYWSSNTTVGIIGASTIGFQDDTVPYAVSWNWTFGDGEYSDVQNATHTYGTQGLFNVTFTTPYPGAAHLTRTDYINISAPSFTCSPLNGALPLEVTCQDTSAVLTGDVWWSWGDGDSEYNGGTVTHTYTVAGDYDVQIQTPSAMGEITTYTSYIHAGTIIPSTAFTANVTEIVSGDYVLFTDESTNDPIQWKWDFNGTTASDSTSQNPEARFPTPGLYSINLTASNLAGNNSLVKTNYITVSNPTTSFIYNTSEIAAGGYVTFNGSTTGSTAATWTWDFDGGTGSDSTSSDPVWGFTTPGNYTVNATSYVAGGSDSEIMVEIIRVYPAGWVPGMTGIVSIDFAASPYPYVNAGTALDFNGVVVGDSPSYKWDFYGDTAVDDTVLEPAFIYPVAGVFDVNFTAYNAISSMSEVKEDYITVVAVGAPYAQFTAQPTSGTPGLLVNFIDHSLKGTAVNLTYNWSFGDGIYSITPYSSTIGDVSHVYGYAGVYDASLTIVNDNGTSNQTREQYITVSVSQSTTWYTPKQIGITAMYRNPAGVPIINATIGLTAIESTLPNTAGLDQEQSLEKIYGINPTLANVMLNGTLIMSGNTGGDGSVGFTVLSSIGYLVEVTDPLTDIVWESTLYPSDPAGLYTMWVGESTLEAMANASINTMNATRMYLSEPDIGNVTMNLIFQDISGGTTNVLFEVYSANNMTLINRTDLGNPGTGILTANYTVPNVRGNGYYYGYNATRS